MVVYGHTETVAPEIQEMADQMENELPTIQQEGFDDDTEPQTQPQPEPDVVE